MVDLLFDVIYPLIIVIIILLLSLFIYGGFNMFLTIIQGYKWHVINPCWFWIIGTHRSKIPIILAQYLMGQDMDEYDEIQLRAMLGEKSHGWSSFF